MPRKKYSISMTEAANRAVAERLGAYGRSATISLIVERYGEMVQRCVPTMSDDDWVACRAALEGGALRSAYSAAMLTHDLPALLETRGATALAQRATQWDYATMLAVIDMVEQQWALEGLMRDAT